jgi:pyruvate carboxylase subunit B
MPGGAIGPNVHMMVKAGILEKYSDVLAEFPVVVEAGGAWTSVTPGSQQYWLQAFNNVLYGRWEKIEEGYGKAVLGYFGRTPLPPDPAVVRKASEQLGKPPFDGDPLEAAPKTIETARQALEERGIPVTDEHVFLVLSAIVPGKKMETNEGIRLLTGTSKIDIPLRKKEEAKPATAPAPAPAAAVPTAPTPQPGPFSTQCTVREGNRTRTFTVTLEPVGGGNGAAAAVAAPAAATAPAAAPAGGHKVYSTFAGSVEVVDVLVRVGDRVSEGSVVATVEAMKAKHDIRTPHAGTVSEVHVKPGAELDSSTPIVTIA